jgi:hypothetical protein
MVAGVAIGTVFAFGGVTPATLARHMPIAWAQLNSGVFALAGNLAVAFAVSGLVRRFARPPAVAEAVAEA